MAEAVGIDLATTNSARHSGLRDPRLVLGIGVVIKTAGSSARSLPFTDRSRWPSVEPAALALEAV